MRSCRRGAGEGATLDGPNGMNLRTMFTWWPALVMGWPAVGVSLIVFATGLFSQRPGLVLAGSVISTPFCLYVSAYPSIRLWGLAVLGLNFLSAWASRRGRPIVAGTLVLPFVVLAGTIARAVLEQWK
jgi:hypothetical protein